jgi:hypothetical protein
LNRSKGLHHYFRRYLAAGADAYLISGTMGRWRTTMRELSAEARLHLYARSLVPSERTATRMHLVALYSALAVIAAIVFGTLSVHPF